MKYFVGGILITVAAAVWAWWLVRPHQQSQESLAPDLKGLQTPAQIPARDQAPLIQFRDIAQEAGVHFRHQTSQTAMHYVPEIMGSGVAWIDYDQDGYMDLFLVQAGSFPPDLRAESSTPSSRLYRNLGDGTFADVTDQVGIRHPGFGQGVAVGDYDNDGYPDLFVTCYGRCHLYHNEPDGKGSRCFREVTKAAGVELGGWCTSCAFGDIHGKGFLDLFVCRYVKLDLEHYPFCGDKTRDPPLRYSCGPKEFFGNSSILFRNNGNGTFTNVSKEAGVSQDGKALGVVILDLDGDGKPDIYVGNDEVPNWHYRNLGHGKLESCGVLSGTAANYEGRALGSMGVDAEDVTGDGRPELLITTYYHEGTLFYRNNGQNTFIDLSRSAGMYQASWNKVGWGTCFFDPDLDGNLDLFVANGHVYRNAAQIHEKTEDGELNSYRQRAQLFRGDGSGRFAEISAQSGPYFSERHSGRGAAMGDFDNDGLMDLAVNQCGEATALLHNETRTPYHWIRLQPEGSRYCNPRGSNRDAIGACVTIKVDGRTLVRHVKGGSSYLSAPDRRLLFGLGSAMRVDHVAVRWPNESATVEHFGPLDADHNYKLPEGGKAIIANCPPIRKKGR